MEKSKSNDKVKTFAIKEQFGEEVEYYPGYRTRKSAEDGLKSFAKKPGREYAVVFVSEFIRRKELMDGIENSIEVKEIREEEESEEAEE